MRIYFKIVETKSYEADIDYPFVEENWGDSFLTIDREEAIKNAGAGMICDVYDSETEIKDIEIGQLTDDDKQAIFQEYLGGMTAEEFDTWKGLIKEKEAFKA